MIQENTYEQQFELFTGEKFTNFYESNYPKLVYFLYKICKNQQDAEDLATETFLKTLNYLPKFDREKAQLKTLVWSIGRNEVYQFFKKGKKRMPSVSIDQESEHTGMTIADSLVHDSGHNDLFDKWYFDEKISIMKDAISTLPSKYRTVITMRELNRMPYHDIATELSRNENTVKSQIKQGRALLVKKVEKSYHDLLHIDWSIDELV